MILLLFLLSGGYSIKVLDLTPREERGNGTPFFLVILIEKFVGL